MVSGFESLPPSHSSNPVQHVPHQLDRPVDRCGRPRPQALSAIDDAWLPEVRDEVCDIGGSDGFERPIAEMLDEQLQAVSIDRASASRFAMTCRSL